MRTTKESIELEIEYESENADIKSGVFKGGVVEPKHLDELLVWVDDLTEFDFEADDFARVGNQINISGSENALFELGKYLIAISKFKTVDDNFHVHIDELDKVKNEDKCEILIRKI